MGWRGVAWRVVWRGEITLCDMACGEASEANTEAWHERGEVWCDVAWQGVACGEVRRSEAWLGKREAFVGEVRLGVTWQDVS